MQFFNFRTKIPLRPQKTAIAQTPTPPNGHWPFCVMKVGMDVVPNTFSPLRISSDSKMSKNDINGNLISELRTLKGCLLSQGEN